MVGGWSIPVKGGEAMELLETIGLLSLLLMALDLGFRLGVNINKKK